ncbi:MAG TPA: hypothetical protein VG796_01270 [Verrucomicrobiales bacterium]|nr:hypothetical protein [Verrucomicrobiales bacterium]
MTIGSIKKLASRMREALAAKAMGGPALALAQEYAQGCDEAAARLEQCCAMLEKGNGYQALQLAETEPALPELMAALSFGERRQWIDYCRAHQMPVPVSFEASKVQAMDAMYAQGITPAHPLYKDYRSAISKRDDGVALRIIRTIIRLNPSDANAQSEQARLEEKKVRECVTALKVALENGDDEKASQLTTELESVASRKRLENVPEYEEGSIVRQKLQKDGAEEFVRQTVARLTSERQAGDWQAASAALARVDEACMEHGLPLASDLQAPVRELRAWVMEEQERDTELRTFRERLGMACGLATEIAGRLASGRYNSKEAQEKLGALEQAWETVARYGKPVPGAEQLQVEAAAKGLRHELERMRRRRRLALAVTSAAAAAMLGVAGWAGYTHYTASSYAHRIDEAQSAGRLGDTEKLLSELSDGNSGLGGWAGLNRNMEAAQSWVNAERKKLAVAEEALAGLEANAGTGFSGLKAGELLQRLENAQNSVRALVPEFRQSLAAKLSQAGNSVDAHLTAMRSSGVKTVEQQLQRLEKLLGRISPQSSLEVIRTTLAEISPLLDELKVIVSDQRSGVPELPADLALKAREAQKNADNLKKQVEELDAAAAAVARAASLDEFKAALNLFSEIKLVEALAARTAAREVPEANTVLAAMLYNDPARRSSLTNRKGGISMRPTAVLKDDLATLLSIRDDEYLSNIYVVTLQSKIGNRIVLSIGKPRPVEEDPAKPTAIKKFKSKFFEPKPGSVVASFAEDTIPGPDEVVASTTISSTASFVRSLSLESVTDASGETYKEDLMPAFARLAQASNVPASVRAHVWNLLGSIVERDPSGWGLTYCPSLQEDIKRMRALPRSSYGNSLWMLPGDAQKSSEAQAVFKSMKDRSYSAEAMATSAVEDKIILSGIRFGGYSDERGGLKLLPDARNVVEFWFLDRVKKQCRRIKTDSFQPGSDQIPPYTPLFFVSLDRKQLLEQFGRSRNQGSGPFFTEP